MAFYATYKPAALSGNHERFEFQTEADGVAFQRVPDDFENNSDYYNFTFPGGMFASANIYPNEDLGERFRFIHQRL